MAAGSKCGGCDNQVTENENAVACDRCRVWYHKDCAGIDAGEFNILKRKKCNLMWLCIECKPRLLQMEDIEALKQNMEELRMDVRNQNKERESIYERLIKDVELTVSAKLQEILHNSFSAVHRSENTENTSSENTTKGTEGTQKERFSQPQQVEVITKHRHNVGPTRHADGRKWADVAAARTAAPTTSDTQSKGTEPTKVDCPTSQATATKTEPLNILPLRGTGGPQMGRLKAAWIYIGLDIRREHHQRGHRSLPDGQRHRKDH